MNISQTIAYLKEQQEVIRAKAERDMAALGEAIITLEQVAPEGHHRNGSDNDDPTLKEKASTPSVADLALAAAQAIGAGVVMDSLKIRDRVLADNPKYDQDKIKRGIYVAIAALIERGKLKRVPGGFQI